MFQSPWHWFTMPVNMNPSCHPQSASLKSQQALLESDLLSAKRIYADAVALAERRGFSVTCNAMEMPGYIYLRLTSQHFPAIESVKPFAFLPHRSLEYVQNFYRVEWHNCVRSLEVKASMLLRALEGLEKMCDRKG